MAAVYGFRWSFLKLTHYRVGAVLAFGAATLYMNGMLIEGGPHGADGVLYLSHPSYARTVLREHRNVLDLHAFTSTGDGLFSFDTADITGV